MSHLLIVIFRVDARCASAWLGRRFCLRQFAVPRLVKRIILSKLQLQPQSTGSYCGCFVYRDGNQSDQSSSERHIQCHHGWWRQTDQATIHNQPRQVRILHPSTKLGDVAKQRQLQPRTNCNHSFRSICDTFQLSNRSCNEDIHYISCSI